MNFTLDLLNILKEFLPDQFKAYIKYSFGDKIFSVFMKIYPPKNDLLNKRKKKKNLAFVMHIGYFGGVEKIALELIHNLKKTDDYNFIVFYRKVFITGNSKNNIILNQLKNMNITCIDLGKTDNDLVGWIKQMRYLLQEILNLKVEIICFTNMPFGCEILPSIKSFDNIKTLIWVHGHAPSDVNINSIIKFNKYIDHVIVLKSYFKKKLMKDLVGKISVIPNGVNPDYFDSKNISKERERSKLQIPKSTFVCTYIGRLDSDKNPLLILKIANNLKGENIQFLIVGDGTLKTEMERRIKRFKLEDIVNMLGYQEDIPSLLVASDTLLVTSPFEGMPISILESMAMCVPPIISKFPCADEILEDEKHGFIVPLREEAYAKAILKMIGDKNMYNNMSKECRRHVLANFTLDQMTNKFVKILNSL